MSSELSEASPISGELPGHYLGSFHRISSTSVLRAAWITASLPAAAFLTILAILIFYAAPEQDDFCLAYTDIHDGFARAIAIYYNGISGRVVPFALIQWPALITKAFGSSLLLSYSLTLAFCLIVFLAGAIFAIVRGFPNVPVPVAFFLSAAFASTILAASPSIHDLLYWLPAVTCYVVPGVISMVILGECVRALSFDNEFSIRAAIAMAVGGWLAAMCNEFTAVWLVGILASSLIGRFCLGQRLQVSRHVLIAAAVLIGWIIVVEAPGNHLRLTATGGFRDLIFALGSALNHSTKDLWKFLSSPPIIGWFSVVAVIAFAQRGPVKPRLSAGARWMGVGIAFLSLVCCYFEYFAHVLSTGAPLVVRAQNQALIFLLFSFTLTVSVLVRAVGHDGMRSIKSWKLDSIATPAIAGGIMAIALYMSPAAAQLRTQFGSFGKYRQESIARDILLTTGHDSIVTVAEHRSRPSIIMHADVDEATACIALYYQKSEIIPARITP